MLYQKVNDRAIFLTIIRWTKTCMTYNKLTHKRYHIKSNFIYILPHFDLDETTTIYNVNISFQKG